MREKVSGSLIKHSFIYSLTEIFARGAGFILLPFVTRMLSPEEFGIASFAVALSTFLPLVYAGFRNALQKYYFDQESKNEKDRIISTIFKLEFLLSLFTNGLIFLGVYTFLPWNYSRLILIPLSTNICQQIFLYSLDLLRFQFNYWKFTCFSFIQTLVQSFFTIYFLWGLEGGILGYLLAFLFSYLLLLPISFIILRPSLLIRWDPLQIRKILSFSAPFFLTGIAYWIFTTTDKLMLAHLSSLSETGIYSVAIRFTTPISLASIGFKRAFYPLFMKTHSDESSAEEKTLEGLFYWFVTQGVIALSILYLAPLIFPTFFPEEYFSALNLLPYLLVGTIFYGSSIFTSAGLMKTSRTLEMSLCAMFAAITNIVLNTLLIPLWGGKGAALATAISSLLLTSSYFFVDRILRFITQGVKISLSEGTRS